MTPTTSTEAPRKPAVRDVLIYPDGPLFERSEPIVFGSPDCYETPWGQTSLSQLAEDLVETVKYYKAAGISAVQVGALYRVIVIMDDKTPLVMVNPTWTADSKDVFDFDEGCLSFPGIVEKVSRSIDVTARYYDFDGKIVLRSLTGIPAQCVQHECEHLDGRLFIEHLPLTTRDSIRMKLKKAKRMAAKMEKARAQQPKMFQRGVAPKRVR